MIDKSPASSFKRVFLILGDQLSDDHPFLKRDKWEKEETIMMMESLPLSNVLPYHPQKILHLFACMRRFSMEIKKKLPKIPFLYIKASQNSFSQQLNALSVEEVHVVELAEPGSKESLFSGFKGRVVVHPDCFFLADDSFLPAKPPYLMENFYRKMRVKLNILMVGGSPMGGQWNFDRENRLPPDKSWDKNPPKDFLSEDWLDEHDRDIYEELGPILKKHLGEDRFGDFHFPKLPTHRKSARRFLDQFLKTRLPHFGPYEDAMIMESNALFHSGLSPLMNLQILSVREIIEASAAVVEKVGLPSCEGFIRQVIGWREFVRLIYLRHHRDYGSSNFFGFTGELPPLYWGASCKANCLSTIIRQVKETGYSHHIPRLMVLGNFALLTKTNPHLINHWFWSAYLDAHEWVVTPNVLGMSQFSDGGLFATKPYVSGGNYINKMSNFCKTCVYDPKQTLGDKACPFNALYWNFIDETQKLKVSRPSFAHRMGMMWSVWNKKGDEEKEKIKVRASELQLAARQGKI